MSHHAITNDNDLLKAVEDVANFFRQIPLHIAASGHEWAVKVNSAANGDRGYKILASFVERTEWQMQVQRQNAVGGAGAIAVVVVVDGVGAVVGSVLGRSESWGIGASCREAAIAEFFAETGAAAERDQLGRVSMVFKNKN